MRAQAFSRGKRVSRFDRPWQHPIDSGVQCRQFAAQQRLNLLRDFCPTNPRRREGIGLHATVAQLAPDTAANAILPMRFAQPGHELHEVRGARAQRMRIQLADLLAGRATEKPPPICVVETIE